MIYLYDGSFEGLLSVIFQIYDRKEEPDKIIKENQSQGFLFHDKVVNVITDGAHSARVLKGLKARLSSVGVNNLYKCLLSEIDDIEMVIYGYIKYALAAKQNIETDFRNAFVLKVKQVVKMIGREVHRMHAFVRFQKTKDSIFTSTIAPDFDVMPLIGNHFEARYKDQKWLIYDTKRGYGIYYDMAIVQMVKFADVEWQSRNKIKSSVLDENEDLYTTLWKSYFTSTHIKERTNMKLHIQHVPKRYWRYLPEKN